MGSVQCSQALLSSQNIGMELCSADTVTNPSESASFLKSVPLCDFKKGLCDHLSQCRKAIPQSSLDRSIPFHHLFHCSRCRESGSAQGLLHSCRVCGQDSQSFSCTQMEDILSVQAGQRASPAPLHFCESRHVDRR